MLKEPLSSSSTNTIFQVDSADYLTTRVLILSPHFGHPKILLIFQGRRLEHRDLDWISCPRPWTGVRLAPLLCPWIIVCCPRTAEVQKEEKPPPPTALWKTTTTTKLHPLLFVLLIVTFKLLSFYPPSIDCVFIS